MTHPSQSQNNQWLRRHAAIAPFGIIIVLTVLVITEPAGEGVVATASGMVELATVLWATIAASLEGGVYAMFWALEQHKKREAERKHQEDQRVTQKATELATELATARFTVFLKAAEANGLIADGRTDELLRLFANVENSPADSDARVAA